MWRVTVGLSRHIELAFMVAGHTKFGPDYGFGVFKRLYRHAEVNTVKDVCSLMEKSKLLIAEAVGTEQGEVLIPCFDWQSKFTGMGKISGIKKFHHYSFDSSRLGVVEVREYAKSSTVEVEMESNMHQAAAVPETLVPEGLSLKRQEYLFSKIRQYVSDPFKDIVCPKPAGTVSDDVVSYQPVQEVPVPIPSTSKTSTDEHKTEPIPKRAKFFTRTQPSANTKATAPDVSLSPKRSTPACSYCRQQGHRNAIRNGKFLCSKRAAEWSQ